MNLQSLSPQSPSPRPANVAESTPAVLRIQSAMVLFALEQALGQFVQEVVDADEQLPEAMKVPILARSGKQSMGIVGVVQETYIGELIDIAIELTHQRSDQQQLKRLKTLADALGLFEIRNAVCHPNRPFHECFWHRMAAFATDPVIDALHLRQVTSTFKAAQEGQISAPPEEWMRQQRWSIANNLPESFDHEITGLIGRQKESQQLLKHLQNARYSLIAIVGPGGCGKTALCLDVLRECCLSTETTQWSDEIVFVTAKTERLTPGGIEAIRDPVQSLDHVRQQIVHLMAEHHDISPDARFDIVAERLSSRRLLVCIDNLETLLRDHPNSFDDFLAAIPSGWRVLVTSRIPVNSATVLTLGSMTLEGAKKLARDYLLRRGGDRLDDQRLEALATAAGMNPLAIRLVLDSYLAGKDLNAALSQTRENIIRFSYTSLMESLSKQAVAVLECLFAAGDPLSRPDIASLLGIGVDEAAEALAQLLRTSLLSRQPEADIEKFALSTAVRDLLLSNPRDLGIRQAVNDRLREQQTALTTLRQSPDANQLDPLAWNFVAVDSPARVQTIAARAFRAVRQKQSSASLFGLVSELRAAQERDPEEPVISRALGFVLTELLDDYSAKEAFRRAAYAMKADSAAGLKLSERLRDDQILEESYAISGKLLETGWGDIAKSSVESVARLLRAHWVVGIWLGKFAETLEATKSWESAGKLRATLGCLRVSGLRRSVEKERSKTVIANAFGECLSVLDGVFESDGYTGMVANEAMKVLDAYGYFVRTNQKLETESNGRVCSFADKHLVQICLIHKERSIDDSVTAELIRLLAGLDCGTGENVLASNRWRAIAEPDEALAKFGYLKAIVYGRPKNPNGTLKNYLFAKDVQDGTQFYVTRRSTGLEMDQFDELQNGQLMMVLPSDDAPASGGTALPVKDAFAI